MRVRWILSAVVAMIAWAPAAVWAQGDEVLLNVEQDFVGLTGVVRPGAWTPMRLTLEHAGSNSRPVICRWLLTDDDGDRVAAERRVTLNPQRTEYVWLYADPSINTVRTDGWDIQVVDEQTGRLLAQRRMFPTEQIDPRVGAIGVLSTVGLGGGSGLGLDLHVNQFTQHEAIKLLRGLSLATLPDRWFGLSMMQAIIWTQGGGDPNDSAVTLETQQALREWVRRGGHLVIVMPRIGQPWVDSAMADMLPVPAERLRRIDDRPPPFLGSPQNPDPRQTSFEVPSITMTVFDVDMMPDVTVLERERNGFPVIVAKRYGFGRVTMIGVDLTDPILTDRGLPNGTKTLWNTVFGWQAPGMTTRAFELEQSQQRISPPQSRDPVDLDRGISSRIAMQSTASSALLAAIFVFMVYGVVAGPITYVALRQRGVSHHAWVAFVAVVLLFSVIAWGGAALIRPSKTAIAHFSVLDIDAQTNNVHTHGWLSLFVPKFGRVEVAVDPDQPAARNTLASAGLIRGMDDAVFLDPQSYEFRSAAPDAVTIPVRSTAKQFELDYFGRIDVEAEGIEQPWGLVTGAIEVVESWPEGSLIHHLPGALTDVLVVYSFNDRVWVWKAADEWAPGQTLRVQRPSLAASQRFVIAEMVRDARWEGDRQDRRRWIDEGFLGQQISAGLGAGPTGGFAVSDDLMVRRVWALSFFDTLPPPNYRRTDLALSEATYHRPMSRNFDLTPLLAGNRVILIAQLKDSPLPAPLTVDGDPVQSHGWTVVRWICDL